MKGRCRKQEAESNQCCRPYFAGALKVTGSRRGDLLLFFFLPEIQLGRDKQRTKIKGFALQVA